MKRLFWPLVAVGLLLAAFDVVDAVYVVAPLLGLAIWRIGTASFASLTNAGGHVPQGDPVPVDTRVERTTYWCGGCGAEVLLLVKGSDAPPRHCGERMTERREIARDALN